MATQARKSASRTARTSSSRASTRRTTAAKKAGLTRRAKNLARSAKTTIANVGRRKNLGKVAAAAAAVMGAAVATRAIIKNR